jgi:Ran GTPase-activating protein (RanGAP) involved in mRNA processing and transport
MQKEQLEKHFSFGLHHLNIQFSSIPGSNFKLKDYLKKKEPYWPSIMHILCEKSLDTLNLKKCGITKNDMELYSTCLYNEIENLQIPKTSLRVLNLSRNAIGKEGAKLLAAALEKNSSLEVLDVSQCMLGVSGTVSIA